MYDAEIGFPGLTIDGTACSCGEGDPLSVSESYEDMVARGKPDAIEGVDQNATRLMLQLIPSRIQQLRDGLCC